VFIVSGGHVLFLALFFLLPLGGLRAPTAPPRWWKHEQHVGAKHGQDRPVAIFDLTFQ
jgi:hypothetical protein